MTANTHLSESKEHIFNISHDFKKNYLRNHPGLAMELEEPRLDDC